MLDNNKSIIICSVCLDKSLADIYKHAYTLVDTIGTQTMLYIYYNIIYNADKQCLVWMHSWINLIPCLMGDN